MEISYRQTALADLDVMTALYNYYLNDGDRIRPWLLEGLSAPDYCGVIALADGEICGMFSARRGIEFTCGHEELVSELERYLAGNDVYSADMLITLPKFQKEGIGRVMCIKLREQLLSHGANVLIVEEWLKPGETEPQFERVGKYVGRYEYYRAYESFYRELGDWGLTCPVCGGSCACGAVINLFHLDSD